MTRSRLVGWLEGVPAVYGYLSLRLPPAASTPHVMQRLASLTTLLTLREPLRALANQAGSRPQ